MKPPTERIRARFPFDPLEDVARRRLRAADIEPSSRTIAAAIGLSRRSVFRLRKAGIAGATRADAYAAALDLNPIELWPEWDVGREVAR